MTASTETVIRKATPADCRDLAALMNMAGDGLPAYLWSQSAEPGEDIMEFGARRAARTEGGFSYTHAHVAVADENIAGMLLGYRLTDSGDAGEPEEYPGFIRPLAELEAKALGTWYVNAVATAPGYHGRGIGTRLMRLAERLASESGPPALSLIVADENSRAVALYERLGYEEVARRRIVRFPGCPHDGDWLLMRKATGSR